MAELYQTDTRSLKQAVRRNIERFPDDFMFKLTTEESNALINSGVSQFVIPKNYNFSHSPPFAFTEQGVAMLSSVLRNPIAIKMNIDIMRAFVFTRHYWLNFNKMEQRIDLMQLEIGELYTLFNELVEQKKLNEKPPNPIGFKIR